MILLAAPALPLHTAGKYVAGAYIVFVAMLLVYLTIMSIRTARTERDLAELHEELLARRRRANEPEDEVEPEREAVGSQ